VVLLAVVLRGAMVVHGGILLFKAGKEDDDTTVMAGAGHYKKGVHDEAPLKLVVWPSCWQRGWYDQEGRRWRSVLYKSRS